MGCKLNEYQRLAVGEVNAMKVSVSKKTANKAQASCYAELCYNSVSSTGLHVREICMI